MVLIMITAFISCKKDAPLKDKLIGEKEILVGTWKWSFTDHYYGWCDGENWYELLTPATESITYKIKLESQGVLSCFKKDSLISQYRIVFDYFQIESNCSLSNSGMFNIHLNNQENLNFGGCFNVDTLLLVSVPTFLFEPEDGCENYLNYFVKE